MGSPVTLLAGSLADRFPLVEGQVFLALAMVVLLVSGRTALGPIPFGLAYDLLGGYDPAMLGLLFLPVVAGLAVLLARAPRPVLAGEPVL